MGPIDSASALVALVLSFIKAIVLFKVVTFQPIIWIAAVLIVLKTIGLLIFWVLLVMAIMSWVSGAATLWVRADSTGGSAAASYSSLTSVHGRDRFLANDHGSAAVCH